METAQTADYALRALLALEERDGRTVLDVAAELGVTRSVALRILTTLRARSAVVRDPSGAWWLGPLLIALGRGLPHELAHVGGDALRAFAHRASETVVLSVAEGPSGVVVAQERGHAGHLRVEYEVDFRQPLDRGASSLALLAHVPESGRTSGLVARRADEIAHVREHGWIRTVGEVKPDMVGLAAPILAGDELIGSLAIVAPLTRAAHVDALLPDLLGTAREIADEHRAYRESSRTAADV